jgi:DNA invertase Pin-like site-specific DNA recombinase
MHTEDIVKRIDGQPQRTIRIIPAITTNKVLADVITREAAYARVSTKSEEPQSSYKLQKRYYEEEIKNKPRTEFAGLYCDEESGKSISGRKGFQELLKDCYAGKIDRIITKTVSRFARNMVECLSVARELKNRSITIYFESQGLDTKDESSFVILSILAALAEEEIRTISNNVKWGIHKRYKEGKVHMSGRMLGYKIKGGVFTIVPQEVEAVQQIFNDYSAGLTIRQIKTKLEEQGILTPKGRTEWQHTTIMNMLRNEKYKGDVILQKTFKVDVLSRRQININQRDKTEVLNHHPAIIDKETFNAVQAEILKREYEKITLNADRTRYSSHYPFSTKLECGECGTKFRRHYQQHGDKKVDIWVCIQHQRHKDKCGMKPIKEQTVQDAFVRTLNELVADRQNIMTNLELSIKNIISQTHLKDPTELEKQLFIAEQKMIDISSHSPQTDNDKAQTKHLIEQVKSIKEEMVIAERLKGSHNILNQRVKEIKQVIRLPYFEYNGDIFRSLVERVIVKNKRTLRFILKCGIEKECQI